MAKCPLEGPLGKWETDESWCYLWSQNDAKEIWDEAEEFCKSVGGRLAAVTSKAINDYIVKGKKKREIDSLWIGGTDQEKQQAWRWTHNCNNIYNNNICNIYSMYNIYNDINMCGGGRTTAPCLRIRSSPPGLLVSQAMKRKITGEDC